MSNFTITTPETNVHLRPSSVKKGATAAGNVTYSVTNTSGSTRRTRLRIDADDDVHPDWVSVRDGDERDIPPGATETFSVDINAPGSVEPKNLSFTAVAVNLEDPDNDFETGPAVAFAVPAIDQGGKPKVKWWMIAIPITLVLFVGGGILAFIFWPDGKVVVDPIANVPLAQAEGQFSNLKLNTVAVFDGQGEAPSKDERFWKKMAMRTDPEAGAEVEKKSEVTLFWKWEALPVKAPKVIGLNSSAAAVRLADNGLQPGTQTDPAGPRPSRSVKIVKTQTPAENADVHAGDKVNLTYEYKSIMRPGLSGVFDNRTIDAVIASQTHMTMDSLVAAIASASRVKSGGRITFSIGQSVDLDSGAVQSNGADIKLNRIPPNRFAIAPIGNARIARTSGTPTKQSCQSASFSESQQSVGGNQVFCVKTETGAIGFFRVTRGGSGRIEIDHTVWN